MSVITYLCADFPLPDYPEPTEDGLSGIELPEGVSLIPAPPEGGRPEIWTDSAPYDENDPLVIASANIQRLLTQSEKAHCAIIEGDYGGANAERLIRYIRAQCQRGGEVELWSVWADNDMLSRHIRSVDIPADELTPDDLKEMRALRVWEKPLTDYRYRITA